MKLISKRKEVVSTDYFTLELTKGQVLTIMSALGVTTPHERTNELRSFYNLDGIENDTGEEMYNDMLELVSDSVEVIKENQHPPAPEPHIFESCTF